MRLEELVLRVPGDELRVRFHEQLTVLCGIGILERQALRESLISALAGTAEDTVLTYTDRTGRQVEIVSTSGTAVARYTDDGTPALLAVGSAAQSVDELRSLMLVQASDLGLTSTRSHADDDPELRDARATLAELTQDLQVAMAERHAHQVVQEELAAIEAQLQQLSDNAAMREYARALAELERVRGEAAALQSGTAGAEADRRLLTSADDARARARRWAEAAAEVARLVAEHGGDRLDPETLSQVHAYPHAAPANLRDLLADLEEARDRRNALDRKLREQATSTLPEPSDPRVLRLATIADQEALWSARDHLDAANRALQREQLAVGGPASDTVDDGGVAASIVARIEEAQHAVDEAEGVRQRRLKQCVAGSALASIGCLLIGPSVPVVGLVLLLGAIVGPAVGIGGAWRRLASAQAGERAALADAGAETYLGFHLRRVDAATNPASHRGIDAAAMEHRLAVSKWEELAGDVDAASATALEAESRRYAQAVAKLGSAAGQIEALRAELTGQAEPALKASRARLIEACAPYGVDDAAIDGDIALVERMIQTHVTLGHRARAQGKLEHAEGVAQALADDLHDMLGRLGFTEGALEARVGALDRAVNRAFEREQARVNARAPQEIEQDLARLEAEAARLRRPEWASVHPSEADGPDEEELQERAEKLRAQIASDAEVVIDLERLADRHSAMERRVASLEAEQGSGTSDSAIAELADVHQYLLAHLTRAGHAGPFDESVPVIFDEAFVRIAAERKWELLDMLRRLAEKTQLIYLSDDPFVGAWARRRAGAGLVTLLEPVEA
jgi:hypothetical protein